MSKKLKRSSSDKIIAGVCGGLGEYFNIDPVIIRIAWIILAFMPGGPGILAYLVCALIIPEDDGVIYQKDGDDSNVNNYNTHLFVGIALVVIGGFMLAKIILPASIFKYFNIFRYWPVLLIIAGLYMIYNHGKNR